MFTTWHVKINLYKQLHKIEKYVTFDTFPVYFSMFKMYDVCVNVRFVHPFLKTISSVVNLSFSITRAS
jgi:uncharacterized protein YjaG (DUF416 family)